MVNILAKILGFLFDLVLSMKAALVVDPVMVSTSGDVLAGPSILGGFRYAKLFCVTLSEIDMISQLILQILCEPH